jgi:hypothetical protein
MSVSRQDATAATFNKHPAKELEKALVWAGVYTYLFSDMGGCKAKLVNTLIQHQDTAQRALQYLESAQAPRPRKSEFSEPEIVQIIMTCRSYKNRRKLFSKQRLVHAVRDLPFNAALNWAETAPRAFLLQQVQQFTLHDRPGLYVVFHRLVTCTTKELAALEKAPAYAMQKCPTEDNDQGAHQGVQYVGEQSLDAQLQQKMHRQGGAIDLT